MEKYFDLLVLFFNRAISFFGIDNNMVIINMPAIRVFFDRFLNDSINFRMENYGRWSS